MFKIDCIPFPDSVGTHTQRLQNCFSPNMLIFTDFFLISIKNIVKNSGTFLK